MAGNWNRPHRPTEEELQAQRIANAPPFYDREDIHKAIEGVPASQFAAEMVRLAELRERLLLVAAFLCGIIMAISAFYGGLEHGKKVGIDSCRAGDVVLVDPAVKGDG